jgi:DNA-binding response OmpR family regulator
MLWTVSLALGQVRRPSVPSAVVQIDNTEAGRVKLLLVEHNLRLATGLKRGLRAEGLDVIHADNGIEGFWQATEKSFDVIVLDVMLPGPSGYEVLRRLRDRQIWTPVIIMTTERGDDDQAAAFDLGADDYLVKPVSLVVLLARLRALVRRDASRRLSIVRVGELALDPSRRLVTRAGAPIDLSPREFGLLEYLMRHPDAVCTKRQILHSVWDQAPSDLDNVLAVYVGYLRRKIDTPFGTNTIETLRGVGYRLRSGRPVGDG